MKTLQQQSMEVLDRIFNITSVIENMDGKSLYEEEIRNLFEYVQDYLGQIENILIRVD